MTSKLSLTIVVLILGLAVCAAAQQTPLPILDGQIIPIGFADGAS